MPLDYENFDGILSGELGAVPGEWFLLSDRLVAASSVVGTARYYASRLARLA